MEKVTFQNSRGLNLVGVLHTPKEKTDKIIIASHGFISSKDRERFIKVGEALSEIGFTVLRFDYNACGESDKDSVTVSKQVDDLKSAIKYAKELGYDKISLLGESLGGLYSLKVYDENIQSMVLWAPVTYGKIPSIFKDEKLRKEIEEKDFIIHIKRDKPYKIEKKFLEERKSVNKQELLSRVKIPTLIIQGDEDKSIPLEQSKEALQYLPEGSKLEIIDGANHTFDDKEDKLIELTVDWFKKHLR